MSIQAAPAEETPSQTLWERRAFEKQLLNVLPQLRAFARLLAKNNFEADDLVQDTVMRCLRSFNRFEPGSNMKAWTFKILHNCFRNTFRRRHFDTAGDELNDIFAVPPNQEDHLHLKDVLRALATLSPLHRETIILLRAEGLSYHEAAAIMSCELGTIKSRANRAEAALRAALGAEYSAHTGAASAKSTLHGRENRSAT